MYLLPVCRNNMLAKPNTLTKKIKQRKKNGKEK